VNRAHRRSGGFALLVVLWFLVLLSAIGAYMMANARSQTALAHNILAAAHAEALADAAVAQAAFSLTDPDPRNRWIQDGRPYTVRLAGGQATIRLFDETVKINPNLASPSLMAGLFRAVGVDSDAAATLALHVADWVRPPDNSGGGDPASDLYQDSGRNYRAPHAPVESLDELQLVLGMTPKILAAAAPYLTIFTDSDAPQNPKAASKIVQTAIATAASNPVAGQDTAPPGPAPGQAPAPPAAPDGAPAQAIIATIEAVAVGADGGTFARHAVIKIDPSKPKGYAVEDWRRADIAPAAGS
jgi:general secretion pathway protein K